ncbi:MAG: bifunctional phosphopantothenoylcysteine decarboxylase/phosphopantothenate--cysteine ligase CoaBC [Cyanobacteria bacterium P01_F01_bin.42]
MSRRNVLVGIGGGIAAYKACGVISTLAKDDTTVRAILSPQGQRFITPLTVSTLCRHRVYLDDDFWSHAQDSPLHIELADWADICLIAPLTANTLAELSHGFGRSLLENVVLASRTPVLLAPAMNTVMWQQPVVQRNMENLLADDRYHLIGPMSGRLACDAVGVGKMAEPEMIVDHLRSLLYTCGKRDFTRKKVLVTAGSTREFMDPVRFIGNPSSGKMGVAIALAAHHRGAEVTLIAGPRVALPTGVAINMQQITTADELRQALGRQFPETDITIMAAAVGDVRPADCVHHKLPKSQMGRHLDLAPVPDLIHELSQRKADRQKLIGFAAQTGDILPPAQEKLVRKNLDAIVANPIDQSDAGFNSDHNQAVWLDRQGNQVELPLMSKLSLAHRILDLTLGL